MRLVGADIAIERGGRRLFSQLSFAVASGEALAVTGRNGAGKSSLLRAIAGLLPLATGELTLEGGPSDESIGGQAHYLGHADALKGSLTARENLDFWASMLGAGAPAVDAAAALASLSAGQRRRVALARLLVAYRPLWLLDEPTSALDAAAQQRLGEIMRAHLGEGGLIVAATHAPLGVEAYELALEASEPAFA
jgi:heme exporter protein A